ncbi:MAG: hypothetical protein IJG00_00570 [Clostridia bacterium]|nr:hypothetical protein [Clostridia bacterium]
MKKFFSFLLVLCFLSYGFLKVGAVFSDFTEDFYCSLRSEHECRIFKNFERYLAENPTEKSMLVKKEFFKTINDSANINRIKNAGIKKVCLYVLDCSILKVFGKISLDNPESVRLASISLGENFKEIENYMRQNEITSVTYNI